jgi:hypothetical protein
MEGDEGLMTFTDWLGQEINVGDTILYCAQSGRSANMALGEVLKINERDGKVSSIRVKPLKSARWKQWYGKTVYIDTRTGEKIKDPYSDQNYRQPWVQRVDEPTAAVTLTVIDNVTKWTGAP